MFVGTVTMGGWSLIVMLNTQVAVLPAASRATQVTWFVPTGKAEPEGGVQVMMTPGRLSVALIV